MHLDAAYRDRLHIAPSVPLPPDENTLCKLVENHLRYIPFENLSFHGGCRQNNIIAGDGETEPPIPLSLPLLYDKILRRKRGGCCFELNGLLGHYLLELGYPVVKLVPCWIYAGPERGHSSSRRAKFRTRQTHAFLLVRTTTSTSTCNSGGDSFIVDVGLGEPPLHPLRYGPNVLGVAQRTPDGMQSRIVREEREWTDGDGRIRRCLRLEWWRPCRACFERRGRDITCADAEVIDVPKLEKEAKLLRLQADRALRKAEAKPRPPFKVFASNDSIREEAKSRLFMRKNEQTETVASDNEIRREICDMWAALSLDKREEYKHLALAETADLQGKAEIALEKAKHAENLLTRRGSVSSILQCNEPCTGDGGWWEPRIQWDISDAPLEPREGEQSFVEDRPLETFADAASIIASEGSTFLSKIVVCILTRSEKITLTGNSLRITSPRFPPCSFQQQENCEDDDKNKWPVQTRKQLSSKEDILAELAICFDLDLKQLSDLSVGGSSSLLAEGESECRLWEHL